MQCFFFGVGLFALAAVGHLMWWIGASLLRAMLGEPGVAAPTHHLRRPFDDCPACRADVRDAAARCERCGFRLDTEVARKLARIRTAEAEVQAIVERGDLDPDAARVVQEQLAHRVRELRVGELASLPAAVAPPRPPTVDPLPNPEPAPVPVPFVTPIADEPPAPVEPPEPRRSSFATFMEARNILWGELVGGLLIVGCSIALVLTFWQRLEEVPYFPFLLSAAVTLALYGAGQYTLHHWKLTSTSRGLLVIVLLLVPLNLLPLSDAMTGGKTPLGPVVKILAVLLFAWVVRGSARDVLSAGPVWKWALVVAVVGAPAALLLPAGWFPEWLALACFAGGVLVALLTMPGLGEGDADPEAGLLPFVGLAAFGLAAAWGLHLARSPDVAERVRGLAFPLVLAAVPVIECGLLVHRRVRSGGLRTTGTGVALAGFAAMTGALAAAWPAAVAVLLVALAAGAFLTRVAIRDATPWAHAGAIPMLALAVVVAAHGSAGRWGEPLAGLLASANTGLALAGFALVLAVVGELFARRGSMRHAASCAVGGAAVGLVALFVATVTGTEFPIRAAIIHGMCAAGLLATNVRWRLRVAAHCGLWLVLVGSLWAMHAGYPGDFPRWGFVAAVEALAFALLALRFPKTALLHLAGRDLSVAAALAAPILTLSGSGATDSPWATASLFVLAPTGLALTRLTALPLLTYAGSAAACLGFVHLSTFKPLHESGGLALLVGVLSHVTLAVLAAVALRRREWLFAYPLRVTALAATVAAAIVLLMPSVTRLVEWAACAAWLGLVWLVVARVWRMPLAFAGFQVALSLAAVLIGAAWLGESASFDQPAALHAYGTALGLLALAWVAARRALRSNAIARKLWIDAAWSAERVVLAVVVVAFFVLTGWVVAHEVQTELTPAAAHFFRLAPGELAQTCGPTAWALLGVLGLAVVASWRFTGGERDTDAHATGVALLFLAVPFVYAGSHAADGVSAAALRWSLAVAFLVGTAVVAARGTVRRRATAWGFPVYPTAINRPWLLTLLAVAAGGVVLLSGAVAELGLTGRATRPQVAASPFAAMGPLVSNLVPLALVVVGLAVSAARERSPGYAFAGGLVFTATVAGGYTLGVVTAGGEINAAVRMHVGLLIAASAAAWACLWLAAERRVTGIVLLAAQSRLGLFVLSWLALAAAALILAQPGGVTTAEAAALADFGRFGWLALAVACAAAVWRARRSEPRLMFHALAVTGTIAGVLAACAVVPWDAPGSWLAAHTLALGWSAGGVGLVVAVRRRGTSSLWLDGFAIALVVMAIGGARLDPWRPWMPAGLAVGAAVLVGVAAVFGRSAPRVAVSGLLVTLAAVLLWLPSGSESVSGLVLAVAVGLAVAAAAWTVVAIRDPDGVPQNLTDLARGAALVLLAVGLLPTLGGDRADSPWLTWGATLAVAASGFVSRRERVVLFGSGVAAVLLAVAATTPLPVCDVPFTPVALAGFAVLSAAVSKRPDLLIPHGLLTVAVIALGVSVGLTAPVLGERLASPGAVLLLAVAAALLLPARVGVLRYAVVALAVLVPAAAAWAGPDPAGVAPWLQRNAWLFVALTGAGIVGCGRAERFAANWRPAARVVGGWAAAFALLALVVNLVQQVPVFDPIARRTPLAPAAVFAMLAAIAGLIVLAIRFALRQHLDPLGLSDNRRTAYVYLAELLLVLFFTHVRLNVPELFLGAAVRYWTFAVMGLAFVGVGCAEFFERRKVMVIAGPLRRTGVLLPLIPLLAFWAKPPAALTDFATGRAPGLSPLLGYLDKLPQHFDTYAWLWFLAGGVYGLVALSRKSFGWALLAALATNAAMWALLTHHEVPFVVHPQAWVIPLALIVLMSEHVNRARLRPDVSNGLRHLGVTMIYVSSAADMFLAGVGQSVWLPVILAVFCVAGVLVGIAARVRSFVYLGVAFLVLDIFAMIWHAAVDLQQTWVWYASGIVLGVAILVLFAVFERNKKRRDAGEP